MSPARLGATPSLDWLKADLLDYALSLGLDANKSMTKQQILDLINL